MNEIIVIKWQEGICPHCKSNEVTYKPNSSPIDGELFFDKEDIHRIVCKCNVCNKHFIECFYLPDLIEFIKGKCVCQTFYEV